MTDLVVFSLEAWDGVWRRNQYVLDGLLRRDPRLRVLFVEPARDVLHELRSGRGGAIGAGLRTADGYEGRLRLFQPTKWLPRVAGPMADVLLRGSVRRALRRARFRPDALWVNDPGWAGVVRRSATPAFYDMTDDWLAAERPPREHARVVANEEILMADCAAVVVCSTGLERSRRDVRPDVLLIPNAVDVQRYRRAAPRPSDLPPGPVAMYVGTLHEDRLDVSLIVATARALSGAGSLVLVGPSALGAADVDRLRAAEVVLLGPKAYETIPAYLQHATALVVPHIVDDFTESLDPLKLYEYRAVGRPIVATPVAGFRELEGEPGVTIAAGDAFAPAVAGIVGAGDRAVLQLAVDVPDWADRVERFGSVIDSLKERPLPASAQVTRG